MPRRPVKPQDRQRVVRACDRCKASKKRCDGLQPCNGCKQKARDDSCQYTAGRRHRPPPRHNSVPPQLPHSEQSLLVSDRNTITGAAICPNLSRDIHNPSAMPPRSIATNHASAFRQRGLEDSLDNEVRDSSSDAMRQPPVVLSNVSGEKVFIGNTAAMSFLRFVQKTLKRHIGPSCFTDAPENQTLANANTSDMGSSSFYDGLSLDGQNNYIQYFLDTSSGLLDLYSSEDVSKMLEAYNGTSSGTGLSTTRKLNSLETASLYLMVAIGAQCCGSSKEDVTSAAELFSYARKLALEKMLENPSLELIRAFLLMAFYMFGACHRNSAFMYLGVASKAAEILGLHMSAQYRHLSSSALNARLRTSKSLRVFDVVCNSIFGRPSSTPPLRSEHTSYVNDDVTIGPEVIYRALALGATYELAAILDAAVTKSTENELTIEAAEGLVLELQQCCRNFPSVLRKPNDGEAPNSRHVTIGNVHVSGTYYFSVILVTRQFLIQHVVPQLSGRAQPLPERHSGSQHDPTEKIKITHLANACIEAATFMSQMCYQVMRTGRLVGNMCIVKAWIFATGLVLGFSLLVEDDKNSSERRTAFLNSLQVLGELKRLSPRAEQYYSILSSFHLAIKAYKEQLNCEEHASRANLVDRVFLPNAADLDEPEIITTQLPSPDLTMMDSTSADWPIELALGSLDDIMPVDPALIGENDVIMQILWESDRYMTNYADCALPSAELSLYPPVETADILAA
ncbi:hypothetical protein GQ44DRAFT_762120 [Phaeosphaeriaceae sp. PMI808]|nr:hypothetical protein GQ44DRAFT_762120 [Phaeosphaeriaceae sp. PMI808]